MIEDYEDSDEDNYLLEDNDNDIKSEVVSEISDKDLNEILNDENVNVIESAIDPYEWKLELERVAPLLKLKSKDNLKDWRNKVTKIVQLNQSMLNIIPDISLNLDRLSNELTRTCDRIENKESNINMNLDDIANV